MIISIMKLVICCNYRYAIISENLTLPSVGFREGARGAVAPPPPPTWHLRKYKRMDVLL